MISLISLITYCIGWNMSETGFNIGIVGSRTFTNREKAFLVMAKLSELRGISIASIISGGAKGADSIAEEYAKSNRIPIKIHRADWKKYGKIAGFIRNAYIINDSDIIVAFWDMKSRGTLDDIEKAESAGKHIFIYDFLNGILYEQCSDICSRTEISRI